MTEQEIIETLIQNKKKGTAFGFLSEEVQEWIKGNYEKCAILTKKGVWDKAQKYIASKDDIAPSDVYIMLFCFKKQNEWVEFNIGKDGYFSIDGCSYHWSQVSLFLTSNPEYTSFGGYQYAGRNDWYTEPRVFCDDDGSDLYLDQYDDNDNCKPAIPIKIRFWRKTNGEQNSKQDVS